MSSVRNCLNAKKALVHSLPSNSLVLHALTLMRANRIRSVLVIDDGKLAGIVTQGDCAIKVLLAGRRADDTRLSEIMTRNPVTVRPEAMLSQCMRIMMGRRIRHLPVLEDDTVIGVVSIGDVVQDVIDRQSQQIRQLETFVRGRDPEEPDLG